MGRSKVDSQTRKSRRSVAGYLPRPVFTFSPWMRGTLQKLLVGITLQSTRQARSRATKTFTEAGAAAGGRCLALGSVI